MTKQKGPYCGGKLRSREGTCTRPAGWGTDHAGAGKCKLHGGCSPSGKVAAMTEQARNEIAKLNLPPVEDPLTVLAQLAAEAVAWKDAMAAKVNELTALRYEAGGAEFSAGEQLRSEVALWERALDRCERFLTALVRCNIEERMARVTERQMQIVERAFAKALRDMRLPAEQQDEARKSFGRHLRAV